MKIFKNFNISKKYKNSAIAIGNFDGFHLGHKRVLKTGKYIAKKNKIKFGLLVFHPLPVMFFNKKIKNFRIDSLKQKIESSKKLGIDFLIIKKFDKNLVLHFILTLLGITNDINCFPLIKLFFLK